MCNCRITAECKVYRQLIITHTDVDLQTRLQSFIKYDMMTSNTVHKDALTTDSQSTEKNKKKPVSQQQPKKRTDLEIRKMEI